MACLRVVTLPNPLLDASPEFRFLADWRSFEIREAFPSMEVLELEADCRELSASAFAADWVLLLEPEVFVGRRTLHALWRLLLEGRAQWAAPRLLSELPNWSTQIHTLGAFERLEQLQLKEPWTRTQRVLPASLWRGEKLVAGFQAGFELAKLPSAVGDGVAAGLAHRFERYYGQLRSDVAPILPDRFQRVLEIGCGEGVTGEWLQSTYGCQVTGIELNPVAAQEAGKRLSRIWVGDVEQLPVDERFDLVLALELFEHLVDPFRFLEKVRDWLEPGGTLILSVPNVGSAPLVEELLAGRFDYIPVGLLCVTHLRFFTRSSLERIFQRYSFRNVEFFPQPGGDSHRLVTAGRAAGLEVDPQSLEALGYWIRAQG
jgi:2-polyprenyl-3-methyl-5-hydroxy-6-metoxy-1,4-benzoquinol methylase